ncbi:hypothetical protein OCU04_002729 [Sclerotinia nivalis]|uniref:Uncharacterized protein n=1 Tax=Sclerotinia nivalis TaxID=352851 RepID=A0A9X0AU90_9HELO|nr:hypothetical protein OCU04_002729 [Sclerotinia nivalis]
MLFKTTTTVEYAKHALGSKGLVSTVAVYVRQYRFQRNKADSAVNASEFSSRSNSNLDRLEKDPSRVKNYPIQFVGSLMCWKRSDKNHANLDEQVKETLPLQPSLAADISSA